MGVFELTVIITVFLGYCSSNSTGRDQEFPSCRQLCRLTPETTEGPYHIPHPLVRSNISEGLEGVPLVITLIVKNSETCQPLENVYVDIWHANYLGLYSGFGSEINETYCRGIQVTDVNGSVTFQTIYPGWYNGRSLHIHVETFSNDSLRHVGQLYFPQLTTFYITLVKPYSTRWTRLIPHQVDMIYLGQGGSETILQMEGTIQTGLRASLEMTIDPTRVVPAN